MYHIAQRTSYRCAKASLDSIVTSADRFENIEILRLLYTVYPISTDKDWDVVYLLGFGLVKVCGLQLEMEG